MFSVVIPTIWKSDYTTKLIQSYLNCKDVYEVILIDNAHEDAPPLNFNNDSKLI